MKALQTEAATLVREWQLQYVREFETMRRESA